jgi:hypothetical protein
MKSTKISTLNPAMVQNKMTQKLVVAADYNKLKDDLDALRPSDTAIKTDTITEVTSDAGVIIDNMQILDGGMRHAAFISYEVPYISQNIQQDLTTTNAGPNTAIGVTQFCTAITTGAGGNNAIALAAPAVPGFLKKIRLAVDGTGNAVITVADSPGVVTITLDDAGDYVVLLATQSLAWRCIENSGATIA